MQNYDRQLGDWIESEKSAIELIHIIGNLWFNKSIELVIFRNQLVDRSASQIMNLHQYAHDFVKKPIHVKDTLAIANAILEMDIAPSKIDVGKLAFEWDHEKAGTDLQSFLNKKLADFIGLDVCLNILKVLHDGFGNPKYAPCPLLVNMVTAGHLGVKSGKGFYDYSAGTKDLVLADRFKKAKTTVLA